MNIIIIDNYDSFTFNLFQLIAGVCNREPIVIENDKITFDQVRRLNPDAIVLSPGPGRPDQAEDFGVCADILCNLDIPLLGVCLGHQGLAHYSGAKVIHAPEPRHGRLSKITHTGSRLFDGIPQGFQVVRYHSLVVEASSLPAQLEALAWSEDGVLMALRHRDKPFWGIQFHPESICTTHGDKLVRNFLEFARETHAIKGRTGFPYPGTVTDSPLPRFVGEGGASRRERGGRPPVPGHKPACDRLFHIRYRVIDRMFDTESVYLQLYGSKNNTFWFGSDLVDKSLSRFIYMGAADGPLSKVITYHTHGKRLRVVDATGQVNENLISIFDYLNRELAKHAQRCPDLPFDFNCGFAGYFGYELKSECGSQSVHTAQTPDAAFIFCDRLVVFDQIDRKTYLVALCDRETEAAGEAWFNQVESELAQLTSPPPPPPPYAHGEKLTFRFTRDYQTYLADIKQCLHQIHEGESYEICLTNQLRIEPMKRPLDFYRVLRRVNPAPYACYLRIGDVSVAGSSPEQFLKADNDGWVSTKPIKGTVARHPDPLKDKAARKSLGKSEKDFAENLMIVDLLRNDLGRVCEVGSVHVPKLMDVETYATVHQLVSTVRGRLKSGKTIVDCIQAAFPGGSMTGAPKIRTLKIIDRLETEARGIYSGSVGFLGLGGAADLNIVIRTAVCTPQSTTIGIGGAIIALSDAEEEFREIVLKARALINSMVFAQKREFRYEHYNIEGVPLSLIKSLPAIPSKITQRTNHDLDTLASLEGKENA